MSSPTRFNECPECGSTTYRNVAPESAHFVYDRICDECETRYTPPTPTWMAVVGVCTAVTILLIIVTFFTLAFVQGPPGLVGVGDLVTVIVVIVIPAGAAVLGGVRHFRDPNRQQRVPIDGVTSPNEVDADEPIDAPESASRDS